MKTNRLTRAQFLRRSLQSFSTVALLSGLKSKSFAQAGGSNKTGERKTSTAFDLREFVRWIIADFEPSVRLPGGAGHYARSPGEKEIELYGVSDMACILFALDSLRPTEKERSEW